MKNILISGLNGFVGSNLQSFLDNYDIYNIIGFNRENSSNQFKSIDVVVHLAGKSHDLKNKNNFDDYYNSNFLLTKKIYDDFLISDAKTFIFISSVKSVADYSDTYLDENCEPNPISDYGKTKLLAEDYLLNNLPLNKNLYILRPCMIYGPRNKGNLNLLIKLVYNKIPWPLGAFNNKRSFCNVNNLCFVIKSLIDNETIEDGVYNISDDNPISTNDLIRLISNALNINILILKIPKSIIYILALFGDLISYFPLNSNRLSKLTESFVVSNQKIKESLDLEEMPIKIDVGLNDLFTTKN